MIIVGFSALALAAAAPTASAATLLHPTGGEYLSGVQTILWERDSGGASHVELKLFVSGEEIHPELCDPCEGNSFTLDTTAYGDSTEYFLEIKEKDPEMKGQPPQTTTSGTFTIDNTVPVTQAILTGAAGEAGWYVGDVTVELAAVDATAGVDKTFVSVDGGAFTAYTDAFRVTGDGAHTIRFHSVDRAGNTEVTRNVTFAIDATAPDTASAVKGALGGAGWFTGAVTVTLTAADATSGVAETLASVDGGPWEAVTGPVTVSGDGAHTVRFRSEDAAGNVEEVDHVSFRIDATAPVTEHALLGPVGANGWYVGDATFWLTAEDATSGITRTVFMLDGAGPFPFTGSVRVTGEGAHTLKYWSTDAAGNVEFTRSVTFAIDTIAPESFVSVGGPTVDAGRTTYLTSATPLTLTAEDATSGIARIEYRFRDGGAFRTYTAPFSIEGEDGNYLLEWRAVDVAGNVEDAHALALTLDNTAPDLALDRPQPGAVYVNGDVLAETHPLNAVVKGFAARDEAKFVDTFRFAFAVGNLSVEAATEDAAVGVKEVRFIVDGTLRATDADGLFAWLWETGSEIIGEHVLTVESEDALGNVARVTIEVEVLPSSLANGEATAANGGPIVPAYAEEQVPVVDGPALPGLPELPSVPADTWGDVWSFVLGDARGDAQAAFVLP